MAIDKGFEELVKAMGRYPYRRYYVVERRHGEVVFTRDKFDAEFEAAFDAALDEVFGPQATS
jgi:hypothetical protein